MDNLPMLPKKGHVMRMKSSRVDESQERKCCKELTPSHESWLVQLLESM